MKILLLGSGGQLGRELVRQGAKGNFDIVAMSQRDVNITVQSQLRSAMASSTFDCVINAAAYTSVDTAENQLNTANSVNRDGAAYVAEVAHAYSLPLIHFSTDYVFDGHKDNPYSPGDPVNPINAYGKSKEAGECEIRRRAREHVILRTSWLYGVQGENFVRTMLNLAQTQELIKVVNDQFGCPTSAANLADATLQIAQKIVTRRSHIDWGTYHYCGKGKTNWYEFAKFVFETALPDAERRPSLVGISSAEYFQAAQRPKNSILDCSTTREKFGIQQIWWKSSVDNVVKELLQEGFRGVQA